jgi:hypothetical protein
MQLNQPTLAALAEEHRSDPHPAWLFLHQGPPWVDAGDLRVIVGYELVAEALAHPGLAHWRSASDTPFERVARAWFAAMHPRAAGPLHRSLTAAIATTLGDRQALGALARAAVETFDAGDLVAGLARPYVWQAAAMTLRYAAPEPPPQPLAPALGALAAGRPAPPWDEWLRVASRVGLLAEAEALGGPAFAAMLLYALTDNLQNAIGTAVLALLRERSVAGAWAAGELSAGALVAELLRYDSPVQAVPLVAVGDVHLGGLPLASGRRLLAAIGAAHRDPRVYAEPERLWPGREGPPPLSFGHGPLRCAGAGLAMATLEGMLRAVAPRLAGWEVDEAGVTWRTAPPLLRGPALLPVIRR